MFVNHTTVRRKSTRRQFQASAYSYTPEFAFIHAQLQTEENQVKANGVQEGALPQMHPRHQESLPRCSTTSWQRECFIPYLPAPPSQLSPFFSHSLSSCMVYFFCKIQLSSSFGHSHFPALPSPQDAARLAYQCFFPTYPHSLQADF